MQVAFFPIAFQSCISVPLTTDYSVLVLLINNFNLSFIFLLLLFALSIATLFWFFLKHKRKKNNVGKRNELVSRLNKLQTQLEEKKKELERLSMVAKYTNNAVLITNGNGDIIWVNDAFTRIYGYTLETFIAERGPNLTKVSKDLQICRTIELCINKKEPITYNVEVPCVDGRMVWIQTTLTPVLNSDGSIKNIIAIDSDISLLKDAEKTLISLSDEIFSQATEIMRKNEEITQQHEELTKYSAELQHKNEEISAQHDYLIELNAELTQKNEEIKAQRDELEKTQGKLIHSEKMASLGVLTAGIAHEINNPINFVYAGVNSLTRDFEDIMKVIIALIKTEKNQDAEKTLDTFHKLRSEYEFDTAVDAVNQTLSDIRIGAERTAEIVEGLRNFSRSEREEWGSVNLHKTIEGVLLLLRNKYKNHVQIHKEFDPSIGEIDGKAGKLNQVFMNIVSNAIDAIEQNGTITIKTQKRGNFVNVIVTDSGKGMPIDIQNRIFDPFFTTKDIGKGVGLGLSITFGIIQEHNGSVEVKSKPNEGSQFTVTLPEFQNLV